jgi:hypothetical protein
VMHLGQPEHFAPDMRPARGLQDRPGLSPWRNRCLGPTLRQPALIMPFAPFR